MKDRVKDVVVTLSFIAILVIVFLINVVTKDKEISNSERRKLASFPEITLDSIKSGDLSGDLEKYFSDQFVGREELRSFKTFWSLNVFNQKDNNELFVKDGSIYKMDYELKDKNIEESSKKIKYVYDTYLKDMNVYYSIIPDKNYYLENDDHLKMDYEKLKQIIGENLQGLEYIDIWDDLSLDNYYKTDLHWKQENLNQVVKTLREEMNLEDVEDNYTIQDLGDFYGTYYGQLGISVAPDKLNVLVNSELMKCATDKELILFRDSFGSSLAPLLVSNYKKITLVDIRYMSSKILDQYIDFTNQDVLFLYSTVVLNQNILR